MAISDSTKTFLLTKSMPASKLTVPWRLYFRNCPHAPMNYP
jgi:hypothetical protein